MELLETKVRINDIELSLRRVSQHQGVPVKGVIALIDGGFADGGCGIEEAFNMDGEDEVTFEAARAVALGVYGQRRGGGPNCTNSDLHEIWNLMKQVAGV